MLCKITINVLIISLLIMHSPQLFAQTDYDRALGKTDIYTETATRYGRNSSLERVFKESRLYEYLLKHPGFIKIQDMAQRVWESQTQVKRRVSYSPRRDIFSRRIRKP